MKTKNNYNPLIALLLSLAIILVFWFLYSQVFAGNRILKLLGGDILQGGYIQFLIYFTFIWAMLEIRVSIKKIKREYRSFGMSLLPEKENYVIYPEDINELRLKIMEFEKTSDKYLLTGLVKKACTKFIRTKSVAELQEIISSQVKINQSVAESQQSIIRYLLWAIPSLGFIGTVIGISQALSMAGEITGGNTKIVTDTLGVAFDTTLVALVLSVFAMWFFHFLQGKEDVLHADMEEYTLNNLVNRIDTQHG